MTPLKLSDTDLDDLAVISEQDILETHQAVVKALSSQYKNLPVAEDDTVAEFTDPEPGA